MTDIFTKEKRSDIMSHIKGKDTKPEILVRKYLFSQGFRFRKNDKRYAGSPDIVLPKYKTIIFIHGCFWHQHENCKYSHIPKSNQDFWIDKLNKNKERDVQQIEDLNELGFKVIVIWECELKKDTDKTLENLASEIKSNLATKND